VGTDWSSTLIETARSQHPHLHFLVADAEDLQLTETFDYVILSDVLSTLTDVQPVLERVRTVCHPRTRIVITDYSYLWEPVIRLARAMGLATRHPAANWLPPAVIRDLLEITGFEVIRTEGRILLPVHIPVVSRVLNQVIARLPLLNRLCLVSTVVARSRAAREHDRPPTCSVMVPCRNERGTIAAIFEGVPEMGSGTELVFVDGHSTDGTVEEIERCIRARPERHVTVLRQSGTGKGDAVRQGSAAATGDILMILDADLTVAAEDLPKFYYALVSGHGEFINGSRMVYPMAGQAMQLLNLTANKLFSLWFTHLLGQPLRDTLCGTKVLWRDDYERIAAQRGFFGDFDPFGDFDLLFGATRFGLQIREIPVRYSARVYGETNIRRFAHGWLLLKMSVVAMRRLKYTP
jgi:hypothetical protein